MKKTVSGVVLLALLLAATAHAQWALNGVAVCTSTGNQGNPIMTTDGAGGAIITWEDYRSGTRDIYAQRVNSLGEVQWATGGVALCTAAGNQTKPAIASDGAGGAIITWNDMRGGAYDIYAQRVNSLGEVQWTADGAAICTDAGVQSDPTIISDSSGGAIITWYDSRSGNTDIYAQRVNASGIAQWTADGMVICGATGNQFNPYIVADGSGGAIITWSDSRSGNSDIYAQRVMASGAIPWAANGVAICTAAGDQYFPAIASDNMGGAVIAWQDWRGGNYNIYAQRVDSSGAVRWTGNGVAVCIAAGEQTVPAIVSDGTGGSVITWNDSRSDLGDIYAQRVDAAGGTQWADDGIAICTAASEQSYPAIVPDGLGGAIIAWQDYRNGTGHIYAQQANTSGMVQWAVDGALICSATGGQSQPTTAPDGNGGVVISWTDGRNGTSDIYAQRVDRYDYSPVVCSSNDIANDQGGKLRLSWEASALDLWGVPTMTSYAVWRRIDMTKSQRKLAAVRPCDGFCLGLGEPLPGLLVQDGVDKGYAWEFLVSVPVLRESLYCYTVNTLHDSIGSAADSMNFEWYRVTAHTSVPTAYYASNIDSGYSVDNLAPAKVLNLSGHTAKTQFIVSMHWNPNCESDLAHYAVHRDMNPGFTPSPGNLVGTSVDTTYSEQITDGVYYYQVCAVDIHGNEGQPSDEWTTGPQGVSMKPDMIPTSTYLGTSQPNPSHGGVITFSFGLKVPGTASLKVYDVRGGLVRTICDCYHQAGSYHQSWDGKNAQGMRVSAGVYLFSLQANGQSFARKLVVVK